MLVDRERFSSLSNVGVIAMYTQSEGDRLFVSVASSPPMGTVECGLQDARIGVDASDCLRK